jgi:hypothetical protein
MSLSFGRKMYASSPTLLLLPLPSRLCAGLQQLTILVSCNFTTVGLACLTSLTGLQELSVNGCALTFPNEQGEDAPYPSKVGARLHLRECRLVSEEVRWPFEAVN